MQRFALSLALTGTICATGSARADGDRRGQLTSVAVAQIFVPNGFDDNDDVVVVLDGVLPSACYRVGGAQVEFDDAARTYRITQTARFFATDCLEDPVPFWTEVHLGQVPAGTYKLAARGAGDETLKVKAAATSNPDDYLYAPIEAAYVAKDADGTGYVAHLTGRFMNGCMRLDRLATHDSGKTIEVLPIAKLRALDNCPRLEMPFDWTVALPDGQAAGRRLLHVRSLNGKAVNFMFGAGTPNQVPH